MNRPQLTRVQAFFLSAFFFLIALFAGFFGLKQLGDENALKKEGVVVQGTIKNIEETHTRYTNYILTYDFRVGGSLRRATENVSSYVFSNISVGQPVEVTYLPSNPSVSKTSYSTPHDASLILLMGGLTLVVSICLLFGGITGNRGRLTLF